MNLLKQLRWNKTVANDFLVTLSAIQFTSGLCEPILMETSTDLSYMPQGWILHLRSRFNEWGGQLWIEHQWTHKPQRQHDSSLMKMFSKLPGITKRKLEQCNMCRLYSKVITVSDICDERGTHVLWRKISGDWKSDSTLQLWPTMPKPPSKFWSTYRNCIRKAYCKHENHTASHVPLALDVELGAWNNVPRHIPHDQFRTYHTICIKGKQITTLGTSRAE